MSSAAARTKDQRKTLPARGIRIKRLHRGSLDKDQRSFLSYFVDKLSDRIMMLARRKNVFCRYLRAMVARPSSDEQSFLSAFSNVTRTEIVSSTKVCFPKKSVNSAKAFRSPIVDRTSLWSSQRLCRNTGCCSRFDSSPAESHVLKECDTCVVWLSKQQILHNICDSLSIEDPVQIPDSLCSVRCFPYLGRPHLIIKYYPRGVE